MFSIVNCEEYVLNLYECSPEKYGYNLNKLSKELECFGNKEEKPKKLGQEVFDEYKGFEKKIKNSLNDIFVPDFFGKDFKIDVDMDEIKDIRIAYVYSPEKTGLDLKVEWHKQIRFETRFKKDIANIDFVEKVYDGIAGMFTENSLLKGLSK